MSGSLSTEQCMQFCLVQKRNKLELRLLSISSEYQLKYAEGCAKTSTYTAQMNSEVEAIEAQLSDDPTSEEYMQNMSECESVENEYNTLIQAVQDQMNMAEQKMQTEQEMVETELEVIREEEEQWDEALADTVENTFSPFVSA